MAEVNKLGWPVAGATHNTYSLRAKPDGRPRLEGRALEIPDKLLTST